MRDRFVLAVSGGSTPGPMLAALFGLDLEWARVVILQVDERIAPEGHAHRNLAGLRARLSGTAAMEADLRPLPVEDSRLESAAAGYGSSIREVAGAAGRIDVVQLGLGEDGHTASLVPGDPVLGVRDADVAVTNPYQGARRMTLTFPAINRARAIVWLVSGTAKATALQRLVAGDASVPAGRVRRDATVFTEPSAAADLVS